MHDQHDATLRHLTFALGGFTQLPKFTYANASMITPVENHFIYLGNKIIYGIFKDILHKLLFSTKHRLFQQFYLFYLIQYIPLSFGVQYLPNCNY